MKKVLLGFIIGFMAATTFTVLANNQDIFTAQKATFEIEVNGEKFQGENLPVVINGRTYLALRDTGEALGASVEWNAEKRKVEISRTESAEPEQPTVEPTVTPTPKTTGTSTTTSSPTLKPVEEKSEGTEKMKSLGLFKIESDIVEVNAIKTYTIFDYKGEYYIEESIFKGFFKGDELYCQLHDKEGNTIGKPILIARNKWINPETACRDLNVDPAIQIKLSAFNLKPVFDGGIVKLEWIE